MEKKSLIVSTVLSVVGCIAVIISSIFLHFEKSWYLFAAIIIIISSLPFFTYFEQRKIKTAEIVTISSMIALSVISRLAFSFLPNVKPMAAIVMITGIAFGPNVGFVTGAVSMFASNFFFGQGLYTPFQMLGMGLMGLISGFVFYKKAYARKKTIVSLIGFISVFLIYGFIVDSCSVLMMLTEYNRESVLTIFATGIPVNIIHGLTTAVVLYFFNIPMINKFDRLRKKYGVFN